MNLGKLNNQLVKLLKLILYMIILIMIIKVNFIYLLEVKYSQILNVNLFFLFLSFITQTLAFLLIGLMWHSFLNNLNLKLLKSESVYYWTKSQFGKYLPGAIWAHVGRIILVNHKGFSKKKVTLSIILEIYFLCSSSGIVGLTLLIGSYNLAYSLMFFSLGSTLFTLITLYLKNKLDLRIYVIKTYFIFCFISLLMGFHFMFVYSSLITTGPYASVIGAFLLSWLGGFLFIIAPGGLGVRESIIIYLLKNIAPVPVLIVISLYSRLVWTASEISIFLLAKIYKLIEKR